MFMFSIVCVLSASFEQNIIKIMMMTMMITVLEYDSDGLDSGQLDYSKSTKMCTC